MKSQSLEVLSEIRKTLSVLSIQIEKLSAALEELEGAEEDIVPAPAAAVDAGFSSELEVASQEEVQAENTELEAVTEEAFESATAGLEGEESLEASETEEIVSAGETEEILEIPEEAVAADNSEESIEVAEAEEPLEEAVPARELEDLPEAEVVDLPEDLPESVLDFDALPVEASDDPVLVEAPETLDEASDDLPLDSVSLEVSEEPLSAEASEAPVSLETLDEPLPLEASVSLETSDDLSQEPVSLGASDDLPQGPLELSQEPVDLSQDIEDEMKLPDVRGFQWMIDIPGSKVSNVISAISLNDRVLLINTLFKENPEIFQQTISKFNSMESLSEAISYVLVTFPEWNLNSDVVYRLMMAVRRRLG